MVAMNLPEGYLGLPLSRVTTPADGDIVYTNRWWIVYDGNVLFFRTYTSPQCNVNKSIVLRLAERVEGAEVVFLPLAYLPY
jgi:hypothetical protein